MTDPTTARESCFPPRAMIATPPQSPLTLKHFSNEQASLD